MREVYLTFDDGPDQEWTPRVLDALADARMHATFFVIGEHALRERRLVARIAAEGHALGNHTFGHRHPWMLTPRAARAQVRDGAQALADVTGAAPRFFRPPYGRRRACMTEQAEALGERVVMWDVSAIDWGPLARVEAIAERLDHVQAGDVVLMHDGRNRRNRPDQLLQTLPVFLNRLRERGLEAAPLAARFAPG